MYSYSFNSKICNLFLPKVNHLGCPNASGVSDGQKNNRRICLKCELSGKYLLKVHHGGRNDNLLNGSMIPN